MDSSALRPSIFDIRSFQKEEEAGKKGATDEEKHLYALATSKGWQILKEYTQNVVKELDDMNASIISAGGTFEEIGKNTVVINSVKEIVNRILNKVKDAQETIEGENGQ